MCITEGDALSGVRHLRAALADPDYGSDPSYATITYLNLGVALLDLGRHAAARQALTHALSLAIGAGDLQNACHAHHDLAEVALRGDDLRTARRHADQQFHLATEIGDPLRGAAVLDLLASCLLTTDLAAARVRWREAYEIYCGLKHRLATPLGEWLAIVDPPGSTDQAAGADVAWLAARDAERRRRLRKLL
ncbi:tetratricopeptide repeat protein [Rhizomonospora bruguierae]|uniref:tetratricopeptide repeat protein n=1 Tax=Rhizomonospora bruguierae TaxID=1581705 RepID=UPI0020BF89D9|nr:tetratricopeptide repeat protein [Micromonospora sp. NBRC 107566]